mgnify:CR=1 FL=1
MNDTLLALLGSALGSAYADDGVEDPDIFQERVEKEMQPFIEWAEKNGKAEALASLHHASNGHGYYPF